MSDQKFERLEFKAKLKPEKYSLKLYPDLNTFKFTGNVIIDLQVLYGDF